MMRVKTIGYQNKLRCTILSLHEIHLIEPLGANVCFSQINLEQEEQRTVASSPHI